MILMIQKIEDINKKAFNFLKLCILPGNNIFINFCLLCFIKIKLIQNKKNKNTLIKRKVRDSIKF